MFCFANKHNKKVVEALVVSPVSDEKARLCVICWLTWTVHRPSCQSIWKIIAILEKKEIVKLQLSASVTLHVSKLKKELAELIT